MAELYEIIATLCDQKNISPGKMCSDLNLSRGIITDLKKGRKKTLSLDTLSKISTYFDVPLDFLAFNPPFNLWEQIDLNRQKFVIQTRIDEFKLKLIWGITLDNCDELPLRDFVSFVSMAVKDLYISKNGDFVITLKEGFQGQKEKLIPVKDEPEITFDDFTYAFLDESKELTEENKQKLLEMAKFFKQQQEKEKNE